MRIPGLKSARRFGRWMEARFVGGALILGYHRVVDLKHDPYSICVSPKHFEEQLEAIQNYASLISLSQLLQGFRLNNLPSRAVALTFDDGYSDILTTVKPLLEKHQAPATVFIPTGYVGKEFWWDELGRLVYNMASLPDGLSLEITDARIDWTEDGDPSSEGSQTHSREMYLLSLYKRLLPLSPVEREEVLKRLREVVGRQSDDLLPDRALTASELLDLSSSHLLEIGAHSVTHELLADLPKEKQQWEITHCKKYLEDLINQPVTAFSYPNGSWSETTEKIVQEAGFSSACGSHNGIARDKSNRYHLPRFWVKNEDGAVFSRWLKRWLPA